MGRRPPLTDDERQRIVDLLDQGRTHGQIAREVGRSRQTVGRVAKATGHDVEQSNLARVARAQETRRSYGAESRAQRLVKIHERIDRVLERMVERHVVFDFTKDGDYVEHAHDEPTSDAVRQYAAAVAQLSRAEMEIVKYDERGSEDHAAVDEWLRDRLGE